MLVAVTIGPIGPAMEPGDGLGVDVEDPVERGGFRVSCEFSHRAPDDPIVHPGHEGMAHSHDFFGNRRTDAHSTYDDMVGNPSSCDRSGDDAAYWFPTLLNGGDPIEPGITLIYYRDGAIKDIGAIKPMPANLKMIAGDAASDRPQDKRILNWACAGPGEEEFLDQVPSTCHGDPLRLMFMFPNCWDGERLDSRDHQSHMAYSWEGDDDRRYCPSSHPLQVPALIVATRWNIDGPLDRVKLASGLPETAHADFWNTWRQPALERLTQRCIVRGLSCRGPE